VVLELDPGVPALRTVAINLCSSWVDEKAQILRVNAAIPSLPLEVLGFDDLICLAAAYL